MGSLCWCLRVVCFFIFGHSIYLFFVCIFYMLFKLHLIDMKFIFLCSSSLVCVLRTEILRKSFCGDIFRYSRITWYLKKILTISFYLFFIYTMCSSDLWKHCWTVSGNVCFCCFWFLLVKWTVKHKHGVDKFGGSRCRFRVSCQWSQMSEVSTDNVLTQM